MSQQLEIKPHPGGSATANPDNPNQSSGDSASQSGGY
jgi:hypothetical protein